MSSLMDQIQGGPPMGGGMMPPDMGGMGGPPPGGPMGPPPMEPGPGAEPAGDTADVIRQMIDMAKQYMDVEDDDTEKAQMAAVLKTLTDFLAREQKEQDDAMGGKLSPRLMRQAYSG